MEYIDREWLRRALAQRGWRADAGETASAARALEHVYAKTYDIMQVPSKFRTFLPIDTSVPTGAEFFTVQEWDMFGVAQLIANGADDLPAVDALKKETTRKAHSLGASYGYTVQDLRRAAMDGSQLDVRRAMAARRAHEQAMDRIAAVGDTKAGLDGFTTLPNVPVVAPTLGQWTTNGASGLQMVKDLNDFVSSIVLTTKGIWEPDSLALPQPVFEILNSTPMSTTGDSDKTALRHFLDNSAYITSVDFWTRLDDAGAGGTSRAVAYKRSEEVLAMVIPQEFEQFPPQERNLKFIVNTHSRVGGVRVQYPFAVAYMDDLEG